MTGAELRERLAEEILIGDGAMGTYLASLRALDGKPVELLNLSSPVTVASAHREYIDAGARLIETNTFAANRLQLRRFGLSDEVRSVNVAGARIAREVSRASRKDVLVGGAVGPVSTGMKASVSDEEMRNAYREQMESLVEAGVDLLILETFSDLYELQIALEAGLSLGRVAVICQATVAGGFGRVETGRLRRLADLVTKGAAVVGVNCSGGPSVVTEAVSQLARLVDAPVSAFPNASIPEIVGGRHLYSADPSYFGSYTARCVSAGAAIVGGCCGTTPQHIRSLVQAINDIDLPGTPRSFSMTISPKGTGSPAKEGLAPFVEKARSGRPVAVVDLNPPKTWSLSKLIHTARCLADEGVDALSVPENPGARVRMDSLVAGHVLQQETGIPVIVHMTCRDRSLIAQHSRLLGLTALEIGAVLAVTGDYVGEQMGQKISGIFDTGSYGLIELIHDYNSSSDAPYRLNIGCAFNANAVRLDAEIGRLRRKLDIGVDFVQTQPVWEPSRVQELRDKLDDVEVPVFVGVLPFVSLRNAEVLNNEFPGMRIPDSILELLRSTPHDQVASAGLDLARRVTEAAVRCFNGVYIIPPFNRLDVSSALVRHVRSFD
ncbi:MAG: bifunctional homocysteine S-methyltransferase/methylenetetrahydrofolate reductase [Firmicutes bacterium]|nr:bifunctional homocysteine S-methyltransferase/methylenetetrahydrofolate reductase [Bacillota bacterium]